MADINATKEYENLMNRFNHTVEGQYTNDSVHSQLAQMYYEDTDAVQALLDDAPQSAMDYVNRYTYWAQRIAGEPAEMQYNIAHQLLRAYAIHAVMQATDRDMAFMPDLTETALKRVQA